MVKYVVIGGGIAGVTCVETLSYLDEDASVTLVSASPLIKTVTNYVKLTQVAETFDVEERPLSSAEKSNVCVIHAVVTHLDTAQQTLQLSDGRTLVYDKLCVCTGGKPKVISEGNPHVVGIRDTESVKQFQEKIKDARRIIIVGNGGIATELVYELEGCEVIWAIKDKSIAHTFVDEGAGQFFMEFVNKAKQQDSPGPCKRHKYTTDTATSPAPGVTGGALGPDWASNVAMRGSESAVCHRVHVETEVEVTQVMMASELKDSNLTTSVPHGWDDHPDWRACVRLTNGKTYGCDLVVSATGVTPCTPFMDGAVRAADGGLAVDRCMATSEPHVFAAGDCCTATWDKSPHWLQMRLWSQARQMGCYAAKCMVGATTGDDVPMDFCFELFTHVTTFFRHKVVLLGRFNGQGLGTDCEMLLRVTKGEEYVKVLLQDGRLVGAVLIGETDLEETFENLILNSLDLSPFKEHLLDPNVDIEDFFD